MSCCGSDLQNPESTNEQLDRKESRRASADVIALIVAGFIAGNSTLATLVVNVSDMSDTTRGIFQTGLLVSSILVALLLSPQLARNLATNFRRQAVSVDLLFMLGCFGAMVFSLIGYVRGTGAVYFEVFSILLVIYCLGSWVKRRTQRRVWTSLDAWSPKTHWCRVVNHDGELSGRVVAEVKPGDLVLVSAGSMIPVDGVVREGEAFVREAAITGEPHVRSVAPGDEVFASAVLIDAPLRIEATKPGDDRLIDRVTSVVDAARKAPSRWQTQADRIATWFTPLVATAALVTFAVWSFAIGPSAALMIALSVLLVACPCAFGFATPVSIWVTLSRLASRSMVVQRADVIERLAAIDTVVFDKTGTLTVLKPELAQLVVQGEQPFSTDTILGMAKSIELHSHHPIATVFLDTSGKVYPTLDSQAIPAVGVRGMVQVDDSKHEVEVGRLSRLHRPCCDKEFLQEIEHARQPGQQAIAIRVDGDLIAAAMVQEATIDTLAEGLEQLRDLGVEVKVFSGDHGQRVERLGIADAIGGMSPDDKAEQVGMLSASGRRVLFIGDGVNDASAMSHAAASISVADGSAIAQDASDIVWHGHDLRNVASALTIARRSVSRLRRALYFAITYNTIGMLIAASGWLHPVVAVLLMLGSSLTVVLHAADMNWESEAIIEPVAIKKSATQTKQALPTPPPAVVQINMPVEAGS
ncbi:heavy metal translocating P-type ATPase [Neorhodopirellula lusitana]|uniref:heavy metal translocating P-type ATPase n=1 Tax=Neorhodopirellula lusitana TaxID=445327 RepID=UPI00385068FD